MIAWGSFPLHILSFIALLTFGILWMLSYLIETLTKNAMEAPMSKDETNRNDTASLRWASALKTIWGVGTGMWAGAALSC